MNRYEERLQARIERAEDLATKHKHKSIEECNYSRKIVEHIPMGQPILVGHHSEGHHRRTLNRSWNALGRSVEHGDKAEYYKEKAERLAKQLEENTVISSDDPDAIKKLEEKLIKLEDQRTKIKEFNKKARKEKTDQLPRYHLANLGTNIQSVKKRIEYLKKIQAIEQTEFEVNGIKIEINKDDNRVQMFFDGIPSQETRTKLKRNGFRWSRYNGCWQRFISNYAIRLAKEIAQEV
jgi:hypothetical protein